MELAYKEDLDRVPTVLDYSHRWGNKIFRSSSSVATGTEKSATESNSYYYRWRLREEIALHHHGAYIAYDTVDSMTPKPGMDSCLLWQLQRQVNNTDSELAEITHKVLLLHSGEERLMEERSKVKKVLLQVDLKVQQLLKAMDISPKISKAEAPGIHLLKISVPTFEWNIVNWTLIWEQFDVAVHKDNLQDVEKLAYMYFEDVVKDNPAKHVIEVPSKRLEVKRKLSVVFKSGVYNRD